MDTLIGDIRTSELGEMVGNRSLFVAAEGDLIVGCGGWPGGAVRHGYVSPEMTRMGVGSARLRALERDYQRRVNRPAIVAGVVLDARSFHENNGYELLELDTDRDGSAFCRMREELS